jgi:predicted AlkP superfamily pyrophosphatase or phosphodiesterase
MARSVFPALALGGCLLAGACASPKYVIAPPQMAPGSAVPSEGLTKHVVLVSIDGLRPDAISAYHAPTLQRLIREGSYTLGASTITPSKTLPSHTSMLTGEGPERHHVLWNNVATAKMDEVEVPTIFGVSRRFGYRTAAFFSKSKFSPLQKPGTLDYSQAPGGWFGRWSGARTATDVEAHLRSSTPNVLFVHLSDPDRAGHSAGWMTDEYGRAVGAADAAVARILAAAERTFGAGQYSVIVTADHGGHGHNHGSDDPRDVTIPWIAWGKGVKPGELHDVNVRTMDTASTVVWLLGVPEPTDWLGAPVTAAFGDTRAAD